MASAKAGEGADYRVGAACFRTLLPVLIVVTSVQTAGVIYLAYLSFKVMAEPALESFIMRLVLVEERNTVASLRYMILFSVQALAVLAWGLPLRASVLLPCLSRLRCWVLRLLLCSIASFS